MIKVLLVDDEAWVRTSVKNKIEWNDELVLCAEASDGYEAIQLAFNLRPDIVITDMRMPDMSGTEMLSKIREFLPDVQSIVISGYNDFDYVKSAIDVGSCGYVLKPIHKDELEKCLQRTIQHIKENALLRRTTQTQLELMHKFLESYYNRLPVSPSRFFSVMSDLMFYKDYMYVLLIRFLAPDNSPETVQQKLSASVAFLSYGYTCTVFPIGKDIYGIFLTARSAVNLVSYSRALIRRLSQKYSLDASIALGTTSTTPDQLPESFQSAQESLSLMHLYISSEIILPCSDSQTSLSKALPRDITQSIMDSIYSHNLNSLKGALACLEDFFHFTDSLTLSDENHILHLLLGDIVRILYEQNCPKELVDQGISLMNAVSSHLSGNILQDFFSYCCRVTSSMDTKNSIASSIQKAEQYILSHYQEDITLKKTASLLYLNASYFSVSFKNITGKNFSEYLTEVRIENAKRLLAKKELRIHQISHLVGYEDCSYFGKIFRKLTGQTPAEYQQNLVKESL